tara:strand:- start:5146 stop:6159 length:1014 start_codon:yes stop_codon:yes gene_type:complete
MGAFGGGGGNFSPSPNNIQGDATVSGKLGVGTATPTATLEVSSTDTYAGITVDGAIVPRAIFNGRNAASHFWGVGIQDNAATRFSVGHTSAGTAPANAGHESMNDYLIIDTSGKVGVGDFVATTLAARLHVSASADAETLFKVDAFAQATDGFVITDSGGSAYTTINKAAQTTYPLDVGGTVNATALSVGDVSITSTPAELNLLDASATTPSAGAWVATTRIMKVTLAATGSVAGSPHTIPGAVIPDNAIITAVTFDPTTPVASAGGNVTLDFSMTGIASFAALAGMGSFPQAYFSTLNGLSVTGKTTASSNLSVTYGTEDATAGAVDIYIHYFIGA